jgi:hypothetical protein
MITLLLLTLQTHQITKQTKIKGLIIDQAITEPLIEGEYEYPAYPKQAKLDEESQIYLYDV